MNRDEVLEMARQAGYDDPRAIGDCAIFDYFDLERFAALVADRTREECAMVCEHTSPRHTECQNKIAAAIRSMKAY